jgi:hypothetical protein
MEDRAQGAYSENSSVRILCRGAESTREWSEPLGVVSSIDVVSDVAAACTVETTPRAISNCAQFRCSAQTGEQANKST